MSQDGQLIVEYNKSSYNISDFISKHPGGVNTLRNLKNQAIDEKLLKYQHSESALNLLNQYKIGADKTNELEVKSLYLKISIAICNFKFLIEHDRLEFWNFDTIEQTW